ncbi:MAG: protein-ribulosamine 3-kinase [Verrucomicrobiales bacterium]|jgi:protein-ribulosamine 3-kinase
MFEAEAEGLAELASSRKIRVPEVIGSGSAASQAFLVIEAIDLCGSGDSSALGKQLADLHRVEAPEFGWRRDNHIGATPQKNGWDRNWGRFFAEQRLGFQFQLAEKRGTTFRGAEQLLERIPDLIGAHEPRPSLLHGDLWGGNAAFDESDEPVIFDPAVYYGDREAELAFTEMFGGFSADFYTAYEGSWPLPDGAEDRKPIYNLYHVLNHFNLFGGGYARQAQTIIDRF